MGKNYLIGNLFRNAYGIDISLRIQDVMSQRGLNEHSNGLLRRNGLPKQMDFTNISQNYGIGTEIGNSLNSFRRPTSAQLSRAVKLMKSA